MTSLDPTASLSTHNHRIPNVPNVLDRGTPPSGGAPRCLAISGSQHSHGAIVKEAVGLCLFFLLCIGLLSRLEGSASSR